MLLRLVEFLNPQAAETQPIPPRLRHWAEALEAWIAERQILYRPAGALLPLRVWRRLLRQQQLPPWELSPAHIQAHLDWMKTQGYADTTINIALGAIAAFYRWTAGQRPDPACPPAFNPAAGIPRPKIVDFARASLLSPAEVDALLEILRRDATALGRRDYAFFLLRLHTGVPIRHLLALRLGQIELQDGRAWVRWRPAAPRLEIPLEAVHAIHAWLRASGRLEKREPPQPIPDDQRYIFVPLARPQPQGADDRAAPWREDKPLSFQAVYASLRRYGRRAGIPPARLKQSALQQTALRIRLDAGDDIDQLQRFMDSRMD